MAHQGNSPRPFDSDTARWLSVARRDAAANSAFLYGVVTTHIFCRPTCPGRVARRANVVFFDSPRDALGQGYRPCKRCEPLTCGWTRDRRSWGIAAAAAARIRERSQSEENERSEEKSEEKSEERKDWTVEDIARELQISSAHLHRQFKRWFRMTPKAYGASLKRGVVTEKPKPDAPRSETIEVDTSDTSSVCSRLERFVPRLDTATEGNYALSDDGQDLGLFGQLDDRF